MTLAQELPTRTAHFRGCRHVGDEGPLRNVPNAVTLGRTAVSMACSAVGVLHGSLPWLLCALAVYWVGDVLDGFLARRLDQETTAGAVLDVVCDRACGACFFLGLAVLQPETAPVAVAFLAEFMVVDMLLSLVFYAHPISSPNYFAVVDRRTFALNWSRTAKSLNSGAVALLLLGGAPLWLPAALVAGLVLVKAYSLRRVLALPRADPSVRCVDGAGGPA